HRHDARDLVALGDRCRARPRRLAADVDDVGAIRDMSARQVDRACQVDGASAVGKGIGGDVDHAHDARRGEVEQAAAQPQHARLAPHARVSGWPRVRQAGVVEGSALPAGGGGGGVGAAPAGCFGARGGRPARMSSIWSASIVSNSSSALAIACILSLLSTMSFLASAYCSSMMRRISFSIFSSVWLETLLVRVIERPRNTSPSSSAYTIGPSASLMP